MMGVDMIKRLIPRHLRSEKGLAILETVPLIVIFIMLLSFGMGFFGIIHTATLHSIGARAYSFETFRNRSNLTYYREDGSGLTDPFNFTPKGWRFHAVQHESDPRFRFVATARPISIGNNQPAGDSSVESHNVSIYNLPARNERISVNPAWIMVGYGMCLTAVCGN